MADECGGLRASEAAMIACRDDVAPCLVMLHYDVASFPPEAAKGYLHSLQDCRIQTDLPPLRARFYADSRRQSCVPSVTAV
jgi:hypothetical protein